MDGKSYNTLRERIEELKKMFPEAVAEGRFDRDALFTLLEDEDSEVDASDEKYTFTWKGKLDSLRLAQKRSEATLRPCKSESKNWDGTKNLYIEGDNLEVLKLLQQGYLRKIKMIYIDPPYNTGNDFVYPDDFSDPVRAYKQITGQSFRANPETAGRYHSNWLCMMYPRLKIAKTLLRDDGVIFISIDDNEVHNLRKICDEVFGEENFVGQITVVANPRGRDYGGVARMHDYILVYSRSDSTSLCLIRDDESDFSMKDEISGFELRELRNRNIKFNQNNRPNLYYPFYINTEEIDDNGLFSISLERKSEWFELFPLESQGVKTVWRWGKPKSLENLNINIKAKRMNNGGYQIVEKYRVSGRMARSVWWDKESNTEKGTLLLKDLFQGKFFDYPKPVEMIQRMVEMGTLTDEEDTILDFFSGSATTAHATMQLNADDTGNRKFIMVQLPEPCEESSEAAKAGYKNICEIGKERVRRAGEKIKKDAPITTTDLDVGFRVFKLDTSNFKHWDSSFTDDENTIFERMETMLEQVKKGRTHEDVLYEIYIKYGVELTAPLAKFEESGKTFYVIEESPEKNIFVCLDKNLTVEIVEAAAEKRPQVMIFARASFDDDSEIINTAQSLEKREIEFRWV